MICFEYFGFHIPGIDRVANERRIVDDAHRAPHIRHRVFILRVEGKVHKARVDIRDIRNLCVVELGEHVVGDHSLDNIVAREANIVVAAVVLKLHEHLLVVGESRIVDLDIRILGLEVRDDRFVDIVAPVKDVQRNLIRARAADKRERQEHQGKPKHYKPFFHFCFFLSRVEFIIEFTFITVMTVPSS